MVIESLVGEAACLLCASSFVLPPQSTFLLWQYAGRDDDGHSARDAGAQDYTDKNNGHNDTWRQSGGDPRLVSGVEAWLRRG